MKSDAEFYLGEYRKCCSLYVQCPVEHRRHRELYNVMRASMLTAYVEAITGQKGEQKWR